MRSTETETLSPRLTFGRFDEDFLECSWRWLNDPELKRLTLTPDFTRAGQLAWFARLPQMKDYCIWGLKVDNKPVGAAGLKHVTVADAEYWGYLGERQYWGRGLGREILSFIIERAREMNLARLSLHVHRDNLRAVALYSKTGFRIHEERDSVLEMWLSLTPTHV